MIKNALLILSLLFAFACSGSTEETADDPATPPPSTAQAPSPGAPAAAPPGDDGLVPLTSRTSQGADLGAPTATADLSVDHQIDAPGASFTLPAAWIPEPPSSSMRLAQATLPGTAGDGQVTVFYFGPGGGGGLESNLERWQGQIEPDAGVEARRESFTVGGFQITWIESQGTLKPSTMGTGPTSPQPGFRLIGAVVEGPQGPWFFKATGPAQTLEEQRPAFLELLRSVQPRG